MHTEEEGPRLPLVPSSSLRIYVYESIVCEACHISAGGEAGRGKALLPSATIIHLPHQKRAQGAERERINV